MYMHVPLYLTLYSPPEPLEKISPESEDSAFTYIFIMIYSYYFIQEKIIKPSGVLLISRKWKMEMHCQRFKAKNMQIRRKS